jgi:hypothetical protein
MEMCFLGFVSEIIKESNYDLKSNSRTKNLQEYYGPFFLYVKKQHGLGTE